MLKKWCQIEITGEVKETLDRDISLKIPYKAEEKSKRIFVEPPKAYAFRGSRCIIYKDYSEIEPISRNSKNVKPRKAPVKTEAGLMNDRIKRQMSKVLYNWLDCIEAKKGLYPAFLTLTLPAAQMHTDSELHRIALMPFIQALKRKTGLINYLWKAEKQLNGNLHYHIVVDKYIAWQTARLLWNKQMNIIGYLDVFEAKHGHRDPNSIDIHKLKGITDVAAYIAKYCAKDGIKIGGKVWGHSDGLKGLKDFVLHDFDNIGAIFGSAEIEYEKEFAEGRVKLVVAKNFKELIKKHFPVHWRRHIKSNTEICYNSSEVLEIDLYSIIECPA